MIQRTKRTTVPILLGFMGTVGVFQILSVTAEVEKGTVVYSNSFFLCGVVF